MSKPSEDSGQSSSEKRPPQAPKPVAKKKEAYVAVDETRSHGRDC
jgi:hypothetical protein